MAKSKAKDVRCVTIMADEPTRKQWLKIDAAARRVVASVQNQSDLPGLDDEQLVERFEDYGLVKTRPEHIRTMLDMILK
jgi:hypothetical protein